MAKLAFLGLGVMGYPMAGYLAKAGHEVTVYNRSADKARRWCEAVGGASAAISPGGTAVIPFGSGESVAVNAASGRRTWSDVVSGGRRGLARSAISDISADPVIQGVAVIAGRSARDPGAGR